MQYVVGNKQDNLVNRYINKMLGTYQPPSILSGDIIGGLANSNIYIYILENTRNSKPYPDVFHVSSLVYQIWVNGLDLFRFCAPDRIVEKSNSLIF